MLGMSAVMKQPGGYWNFQYTREILQFSSLLSIWRMVSEFTLLKIMHWIVLQGVHPRLQLQSFFHCVMWITLPRLCFMRMSPCKYYTWSNKSLRRRKQGTVVAGFAGVKEAHVLGRVYTINPRQGECFYLRLLLHHVRGPQSLLS